MYTRELIRREIEKSEEEVIEEKKKSHELSVRHGVIPSLIPS
jgi:hypothetical protein